MNPSSDSGYLTKAQLTEKFLDKEIFIYGVGIDSEAFLKDYDYRITVKGFVDSYRYGNVYLGLNVISPEQYTARYSNVPVIIMAARYALEIKKRLENSGLAFGKDFFIYDNSFFFHADKITEDFIKLNQKRWKTCQTTENGSKSIILMPFDTRHSAYDMLRAAYVANYYAKETNSRICAYIRMGGHYVDVGDNFKRIYQSLNVTNIIDDSLTEGQKKRVTELTSDIWSGIHSWADWNAIVVYGIHFGTTIVRHMMRHIVPPLEADDKCLVSFLKVAVGYIIFWYDFFSSHDVKLTLLGDGVCWDGYIRDIAIERDIPTYSTADWGIARMTLDFNLGRSYPYYKEFWNKLSTEEKQFGIDWAKQSLNRRLKGVDKNLDIQCEKNVFSNKIQSRILTDDDRTKLLICPHVFEEDSLYNGEFLFDNSNISWLTHLGDLSNRTPDFDWYLKLHPTASKRDFMIIDKLLEKYPKIKKIDSNVSPKQLKEEGISVALTISGTIAYEYPLIGIEVITCGNYPGISFNFAWNPKTIEEYDSLILNARNLPHKKNIEEIYQFFAVRFLYYDFCSYCSPLQFVDNLEFYMSRYQLAAIGKDNGTWKYKVYMDECTDERHKKLMNSIPDILAKADSWRPDGFYKKTESHK